MASYRIAAIPGDGIGQETVRAARSVLDVVAATEGFSLVWEEYPWGCDHYLRTGSMMDPDGLDRLAGAEAILLGAVGRPDVPDHVSLWGLLIPIRRAFDQYVSLRPARTLPGIRAPLAVDRVPVDLVVVRENTEDLYAGIEFESGTPEATELIDFLNARQAKQIRPTSGISIKPISPEGAERIVRYAFEYARDNGRKRVSCITKANIMKHTDGLFLAVFREVAAEYPEIEPWENLVDALCMGLVQRPEEYDVLVLPNLYGDIISDLTAGLVGGLGVAPGANIGEDAAVFEATHGSAPKYKGLDRVNPTAMILSGKLMLEHLGERDAASRLEAAVAAVIAEGDRVTYDLKPSRDDPTAVGTAAYADAIIEKLQAGA